MTRVLAAGLVTGSLAGAVLISRDTPAPQTSLAAAEPLAQAVAVTGVQAEQAAADARAAALARAAQQAVAKAAAAKAAALRAAAAKAAAAKAAAAKVAAAPAPTAIARVAAAPRTRVVTSTVPSYLRRGQAALARLDYPVSKLGYRVVFKPGTAGLLGTTDSGTRTVTVYVRSSMSDLVLDHTLAHEIGHALDFTRGTRTKHLTYLGIRGLPASLAGSWYGCNDCTDYRTPAGDWAEVFAYWLAGPGDFRSQMGRAPSAAQLRLLAPLFRI